MKWFLPACLGFAIAQGAVAQGPLQSSWQALAPLQVSTATWPAGPLTSGSLSGQASSLWWNLDDTGTVHTVLLSAGASSNGYGSLGIAAADVLLSVTAATPCVATVEVDLFQGGSAASPGTRVDLGNDGTVEVPSQPWPGSSGREQRSAIWDFATGPLFVRIRTSIAVSSSTWYSESYLSFLELRIRPWVAGAQPIGSLCSATGRVSNFLTNYALTMEPAAAPQFAELRARGAGEFAAFLIGLQPGALPLTLPPPYQGTCDVLTDVIATAVGVPAAPMGPTASPQPSLWTLPVPPLPPGLTLYLQHASATSTPSSYWFGASNLIRLDT